MESVPKRVNFESTAAAVIRDFTGDYLDVGEGAAGYSSPGSPINVVKGMNRAVTPAELDTVIAFYSDRRHDTILEIAPWVETAMMPLLIAQRFERIAVEDVMARPAGDGEEDADDCHDAEAWSRLLSLVFLGGVTEESMALGRSMFALSKAQQVGIWRDGELAAAAGLSFPAGVALFAGDATLPAFRGQGLQQKLIRGRMRRAFRAGCEFFHAEVLPGSGSQRNYERCGFTRAYSRAHYRKQFSNL